MFLAAAREPIATMHNICFIILITALPAQAGDLAVEASVSSDDDDDVIDITSLGGTSESSSVSSGGRHSRIEEVCECLQQLNHII